MNSTPSWQGSDANLWFVYRVDHISSGRTGEVFGFLAPMGAADDRDAYVDRAPAPSGGTARSPSRRRTEASIKRASAKIRASSL